MGRRQRNVDAAETVEAEVETVAEKNDEPVEGKEEKSLGEQPLLLELALLPGGIITSTAVTRAVTSPPAEYSKTSKPVLFDPPRV